MTRIPSLGQAARNRLGKVSTSAGRNTAAAALMAILAATPGRARADDACGLDEVRIDIKRLAPSTSTSSVWVQAELLEGGAGAVRTVSKDGSIAVIAFSRHVQASVMKAPRDFTFRSGWLLNTQFAFRDGARFQIRARYDVPSGATFYALTPPDEPYLTIFARPDGTLCNKVMNTNAGDHGFLVREYKSSPATKLVMDTRAGQEEPMVLRIIYLGTAGGVASFREVWSRQGRILETADHRYDPGARRLNIAGVDIEIASIDAAEVRGSVLPPPPQLAWSTYWARRFED